MYSVFQIASTLIATYTLWFPAFWIDYTPPHVSPKKGICIGSINPDDWYQTGSTWAYNWSVHFNLPNIETVDMVEKEHDAIELADWPSKWLLGFNEPELPNQSNLTPELAARYWYTIENHYPDKFLVSPANVYDAMWLDRFRESYHLQFGNYPRLDALAIHCYYKTSDECIVWVSQFIDKARNWNISQVWVTEFSFYDVTQLAPFMAWMEHEPMIARYAYYINREYQIDWPMTLFTRDGTITEYGRIYAQAGNGQ